MRDRLACTLRELASKKGQRVSDAGPVSLSPCTVIAVPGCTVKPSLAANLTRTSIHPHKVEQRLGRTENNIIILLLNIPQGVWGT